MNEQRIDPMQISILVADPKLFSSLGEVTTRDIFEQNSTEFHRDGLFSPAIFGQVGSTTRMTSFGYIHLGLKILHPRAYKELISLSSLYKEIITGKKYAIFDTKLKDFVESDPSNGKTGFEFFIKHFEDIEFKTSDSVKRKFKILFLNKYSLKELLMDRFLVIPAGIRDYTITESGKPLENEINGLYRKVISVATTAKQFKTDNADNEFTNDVRNRLQRVVVDVYDYIENILEGKGGFLQSKWAKRSIMYGTRNVLTSVPNVVDDLEDDLKVDALNSIVGVFQACKGLLPITLFEVRTRFLSDIFDQESTRAQLINPKTLKREFKDISEKTRSKWVTDEGLEDNINKLKQTEIISGPIIVDGYYMLLVYETKDEVLIVSNVDMLPEDVDKSKLRPITYLELFYLSLYDIISNYPVLITRYPITGLGSINPSIPYLKSTVKGSRKKVKVYTSTGISEKIAPDYPIYGTQVFMSVVTANVYLDALGADYDGFDSNGSAV